MNRRKFLVTTGTAVLTGSTIHGAITQPALGVEFELAEIPEENPDNIDTILVKFQKFEITPQYLNDNEDIDIKTELNINEHGSKQFTETISITNGQTHKISNKINDIPIETENATGTKLSGEITITVEHPDITETYTQTFDITSPNFIEATGGTTNDVTINGTKYRVHAFTNTGSNTFEVNTAPSDRTIDVLIVGGGGGGGSDGGGGGGAGGLIYKENYSVNQDTYNIYVGQGGNGDTAPDDGVNADNGEDSSFDNLTALGGGGGASWNAGDGNAGSDGGSGGGAAGRGSFNSGGSATQPSSTDGGLGNSGGSSDARGGGGGGGAGESGVDSSGDNNGEDGGDGKYYGDVFSEDYGENGYFAGGGGGGHQTSDTAGGTGGLGGGADSPGTSSVAPSGTSNTGGGGAGSSGNGSYDGGDGGSGIVLIRYLIE